MIRNRDEIETVVDGLSRLILDAAIQMQSERYQPRGTADEMDAFIAHRAGRVAVLRRLREQFEDEMAQPVAPQF